MAETKMMIKQKLLGFLTVCFAIVLIAGIISGCTDKAADNPDPGALQKSIPPFEFGTQTWWGDLVYNTSLDLPPVKPSVVYVPPSYALQGRGYGRPYPTLYFLPPYGKDANYFTDHGLQRVVDRLIRAGVIEPMIIVSIDGRSALGGSFYTNSPRQGNWADMIDSTLPERIGEVYNTLVDKDNRAITGIGMGGYGALRAALESDNYSSVSVINAPLDFDGTGNDGFKTLFAQLPTNDPDWITLDGNDTLYLGSLVDTSVTNKPLSLLVSAAGAFSPHVTHFDTLSTPYTVASGEWRFDWSPTDYLTDDSSTLIATHSSHFPINTEGTLDDSIWHAWMKNNLDSLYMNAGQPEAFRDMPKLLIQSSDNTLSYKEQMDAFRQFAADQGIQAQYSSFSGSPGLPPSADNYLYDLFEQILIFHSQHFNVPEGLE
jgi:hypothetical protein